MCISSNMASRKSHRRLGTQRQNGNASFCCGVALHWWEGKMRRERSDAKNRQDMERSGHNITPVSMQPRIPSIISSPSVWRNWQ